MNNTTHKNSNQNITVQRVTAKTITLNINGKLKEINNDIGELRAILEKLNSSNVQFGEKIYNIGEIEKAEFKTIVNQFQQESKRSYYLRLFLFVIVPTLAICIAYLLYQYWWLQQPVVLTVAIDNLTPNSNLPLEKANITLVYGDKSEKQEVKDEAIFKGIPASFRGEDVEILFKAEGFFAVDTTIELSENLITLPIKRDDTYARIFGIVKEEGRENRLENVIVFIEDFGISDTTDENGAFNLLIPFENQREQQRVVARKNSYKVWDRIEPVIKDYQTTIYLTPLSK